MGKINCGFPAEMIRPKSQYYVKKNVDYCKPAFKGLVHPKMKIKSLITHPHAVPTP